MVVAGGFGAGKTTFVRAVSEIEPVTSEALMTEASAGADDLSATPDKTMTTVAMDFGRVSLDADLALYLFGTPGQDRFWFLWDDLIRGALGAVVLADPRRLADCFPAIEYFENVPDMPFIVALNCFDGILPYGIEDVRAALAIDPEVPLLTCDARDTASAVYTLTELVRYAMNLINDPVFA
jgi:signal recognition particle receptor subunit beta